MIRKGQLVSGNTIVANYLYIRYELYVGNEYLERSVISADNIESW